ncbi:DUF4870 domain-containing protein [Homoserinibacter sp. GY 40078]|uniref:DUF4870 domain-containing protein n=1 Tax=Homoserinibacter sp. GY 40078 TaxID=2603275 RepID=UPI0011C815B5|nr:DUF4870 domain-containing protein [Homoserinibacter sp. GY 40078]TXK17164.1 DUF4870 domain-containing protein [Homoserinibacter sp. GY 40078]
MTATPPPPPPAASPAAQEMSPADQRLWSTLTHVGGILFSWLAPLIAYLVLKDRGAFVRAHTATALNFQLTLLIAYVVGFILTFVVIGFVVWFAAWVLAIIFGIMAAIAANKGEFYTYPLSIKFVS